MSLTFFLVKLLKEFQHQDITAAIEQQRSNTGTPNEHQFLNEMNFDNKNSGRNHEDYQMDEHMDGQHEND